MARPHALPQRLTRAPAARNRTSRTRPPRLQCVRPLPVPRAYVVIGGHAGDEVEAALLRATGLPQGIVERVARSLEVPRVEHRRVRAAGCSSVAEAGAAYSFGAAETLVPWLDDASGGRREAWISAPGTYHRGEGREWLEYELAGDRGVGGECGDKHALLHPGIRRLRTVSVRIPVPPAGPLAARMFHLEAPREEIDELLRWEGGSEARGSWRLGEPGLSGDERWVRASSDFELLPSERGTNPMYEWAVAQWSPRLELAVSRVRLVFTSNFTGKENPWADAVGVWEVRFAC